MSKWILLTSLLLASPVYSAKARFICGDHWLKISVVWTEGSTQGKAYFSGDSGPERDSLPVGVANLGDRLWVTFIDAKGGSLILDGLESGNLIGRMRETKRSSVLDIAPCRRD